MVSKDTSTGPLRKGAAETQPSLEAGAQPWRMHVRLHHPTIERLSEWGKDP